MHLNRFLSRIGRLLVWLPIGGLIAGVVSPWLADQIWICEIFCHFQVQYVAGLAFVTSLFLFRRRWRVGTVLAGFALVSFLIHWFPIYLSGRMTEVRDRTLRLLSTNLDFANTSPDRFYALVDQERPDVIVVFELTREWAKLLKIAERGYVHSRLSPSPGHSGCGIYSRVQLRSINFEAIGPYPNFVVVAEVDLPGEPLRLFGTHPLAPYTKAEQQARNAQLEALARRIGGDSKRTIVVGDFNTSSWSPCFGRFANAIGLQDSRQGFGLCPSFPTRCWPIRTTIDHCLVSPDIGVVDRRTGPDIGSDHLPILIDLHIP